VAKPALRRASVAVLLIAGILAVAGCSQNTAEAGDPAPSTAPSVPAPSQPAGSRAGFNKADVMFAQMVVPHHGQGVAMVELAATRASSPQVKTLAAAIGATQKDEAARAAGWLREWKQPATAAKSEHDAHGGMPGTSPQVFAALQKASGPAFDKMLLDTLIAHQDDAIQIARSETGQGVNQQARALAASIEKSRAAQITMMLDMLKKK
jgi:uncharacterized protein (DUF305 family)